MRYAITRDISSAIERCELTHVDRVAIDVARARRQHEAYERCLAELGCTVVRLPADDEMPDSVFIEDAAVVFDEVAVITRPGAESRRRETAAVAEALAAYRPVATLAAPATLDGGDVLRMGRRVFVGASARSNAAGIEGLRAILAPYGYTVEAVEMRGCLHLKTAVTGVADDAVLLHEAWIDAAPFAAYRRIAIDPTEPFAANALRVADAIVFPEAFPRTADRLRAAGLDVRPVPADELAKAEGGVTCCSLVFEA